MIEPVRFRPLFLAFLTMLTLVMFAPRVRAEDYDVRSMEWNGLSELVRLGQQSGIDLRPTRDLPWGEFREGDGLLMLYPLSSVDLKDLSAFLEDGGRLGLFDDFGDSAELLQWFQVTRIDQVNGHSRSTEIPGLFTAVRHHDHPLGDGVDSIVTNFPVAMSHPKLEAIFDIEGDEKQGVVFAGQVGPGRLVLSGDPSLLINTMMRFPGNRRFALNLLTYLAGHPGGRVYLVHGTFAETGRYKNRSRSQNTAQALVSHINDAIKKFSSLTSGASGAQVLASIIAALAMLVLVTRAWGPPPNDSLGPAPPSGTAASVPQKISLFSRAGANMLYPTLLARRLLERESLAAAKMNPPTDAAMLIKRLGDALTAEQARELRALLVEFDEIASRSDEQGPYAPSARVGESRFLSLWQRIGAILPALKRPEGQAQ